MEFTYIINKNKSKGNFKEPAMNKQSTQIPYFFYIENLNNHINTYGKLIKNV